MLHGELGELTAAHCGGPFDVQTDVLVDGRCCGLDDESAGSLVDELVVAVASGGSGQCFDRLIGCWSSLLELHWLRWLRWLHWPQRLRLRLRLTPPRLRQG